MLVMIVTTFLICSAVMSSQPCVSHDNFSNLLGESSREKRRKRVREEVSSTPAPSQLGMQEAFQQFMFQHFDGVRSSSSCF